MQIKFSLINTLCFGKILINSLFDYNIRRVSIFKSRPSVFKSKILLWSFVISQLKNDYCEITNKENVSTHFILSTRSMEFLNFGTKACNCLGF